MLSVSDYYINWDEKKLSADFDAAMLNIVLPALRQAIDQAAAEVAKGGENTPLARSLAAEILIRDLAEYLALSSFEDCDLMLRPAMLADESFARWWFQVNEGEGESCKA